MDVQLEMHVNEAPFARSFILSDCDLARVSNTTCFAILLSVRRSRYVLSYAAVQYSMNEAHGAAQGVL